MKWRFVGKFSQKIGQDYIYECDKCGKRVKVKKIEDLPKIDVGKDKRYYCPKCKELEKW